MTDPILRGAVPVDEITDHRRPVERFESAFHGLLALSDGYRPKSEKGEWYEVGTLKH